MNAEDAYEELRAVIAELAEANEAAPVVVEGERDVRSLRALGLKGTIIPLNRGYSVVNFCERLAAEHRTVIVLTDWDVRGGRLARLLREGLAANGVRRDDDFRARIAALCRREVTTVEDLYKFLERIAPRGEDGRRRLRSNRAWYAGRWR